MSDQVHSITDAPQKHSDEQNSRMVRYAVSMSIRMVCFILAVILQNWMTWVLLAAAVVLPYVAVTTANVGADRYMGRRQSEDLDSPALLGTAHEEGDPESDRQWWEEDEPELHDGYSNGVAESEVISGELVEPDGPEHPRDTEHPRNTEHPRETEQPRNSAETPQDPAPEPLDDQDTHR
ncbi:DUF3099 domain-containing protein [Nesterenkonia jeotgali]|uniref:DUF3099 domain-containing protein n=1 Tax=Nesterenkonia jeotgali TaxID=317018 RepID=A0A0W8ID47_9MICC|nr:DUF3099 domain-containing protein [Nesterenkonia jeotgali]KUG57873.1 hypothetical protein AVL63_04965 [Nesterenkonia jeotgali]